MYIISEFILPPVGGKLASNFFCLYIVYNSFFSINLKKYLTSFNGHGNIYLLNSFTKPYEKKSSLDGHSTENPVLVRWVSKNLNEDGLFLG